VSHQLRNTVVTKRRCVWWLFDRDRGHSERDGPVLIRVLAGFKNNQETLHPSDAIHVINMAIISPTQSRATVKTGEVKGCLCVSFSNSLSNRGRGVAYRGLPRNPPPASSAAPSGQASSSLGSCTRPRRPKDGTTSFSPSSGAEAERGGWKVEGPRVPPSSTSSEFESKYIVWRVHRVIPALKSQTFNCYEVPPSTNHQSKSQRWLRRLHRRLSTFLRSTRQSCMTSLARSPPRLRSLIRRSLVQEMCLFACEFRASLSAWLNLLTSVCVQNPLRGLPQRYGSHGEQLARP
jgi:hypothetical protein